MKTFKIDPDSLAVESFATSDAQGPRGTLQPHEAFATRPAACDPFSVPPRCS